MNIYGRTTIVPDCTLQMNMQRQKNIILRRQLLSAITIYRCLCTLCPKNGVHLKISLFLIKIAASREQRTKFSSLLPFILGLKNKTGLKEPAGAGIYPFQPDFLTVFPARLRENSLVRVSLGKERRKFCPLFPCKPDLKRLEEILVNRPASRGPLATLNRPPTFPTPFPRSRRSAAPSFPSPGTGR